jgi:hypothetical protein
MLGALKKYYVELLIFLSVTGCIILFASQLMVGANLGIEPFETTKQAPGCFTHATRGSDGKIHVQPGDQSFESLSDYVSALSDQYAGGKLCIPPQVKEYNSPVEGVLGGLGTNTIGPEEVSRQTSSRSLIMNDIDRPWDTTPINDVDDYDRTQVYETERNSRHGAMSTAVINELGNKYQMDWAQLPFNSEAKAAQEDAFVAGRLENVYREPKSGTFFKTMMGDSLFPPNVQQREEDERKILNTYKPPQVAKNEEEVETSMIGRLVKKLFASDLDYEPVVEKSGPNKWDITELIPKPKKETWADADQGTSIDSAVRAGWIPPQASMQIFDHQVQDPSFYRAGVADQDNKSFWSYSQFNRFTPELERQFSPSLPTRDWY